MGYIWGSYFNIPEVIFYVLKGDYSSKVSGRFFLLFLAEPFRDL